MITDAELDLLIPAELFSMEATPWDLDDWDAFEASMQLRSQEAASGVDTTAIAATPEEAAAIAGPRVAEYAALTCRVKRKELCAGIAEQLRGWGVKEVRSLLVGLRKASAKPSSRSMRRIKWEDRETLWREMVTHNGYIPKERGEQLSVELGYTPLQIQTFARNVRKRREVRTSSAGETHRVEFQVKRPTWDRKRKREQADPPSDLVVSLDELLST